MMKKYKVKNNDFYRMGRKEKIMKKNFKNGDKVKILWDRSPYEPMDDGDYYAGYGVITEVNHHSCGMEYFVSGFFTDTPEYGLYFRAYSLEKVNPLESMSKDTQKYLKVKFENEELEEIVANNPIINEWRMAYVEKVVPPTIEEVLEALSKYTTDITAYNKHKKEFFDSNGYICYFNKGIYFNDIALPPYLITLIGRFYEGLK